MLVQILKLIAAAAAIAIPAAAQTQTPRSIPISSIRYDVTFDSTTASSRTIRVAMTFAAAQTGNVLLSLPKWTPGAYEIGNYARFVSDFNAMSGKDSLDWDKMDGETWRIALPRAGEIKVSFDYKADSLDNANSWSKSDFAFFNGTNLFPYPEGQSADFVSTVTVHTDPSWKVMTGMKPSTTVNSFTAPNYHDLVDFPFFIGKFDADSTMVVGKTMRFASYPAGSVTPTTRTAVFQTLARIVPYQAAIFGEVPWDTYTVFQVADQGFAFGAASGLEHQNSHLDIISPIVLGNPILPSLYSHEVFHAWNVKRLRPAEMTPYQYDREQPTPLLWISEGVTDYYADLAQVRGKSITPRMFYGATTEKIGAVIDAGAQSLEDAAVSTWIKPVDGSDLYYDKGSVAGLLVDIMIRDATDNRASLDNVMRDLYDNTYKKGRGFTNQDWWSAVSRAAGGKSFSEFERRYIDGREQFPYDSILPLAGLRLFVERTVRPSLGISVSADDDGQRVMQVVVSGPGATAGVKLGDYLLKVGGLDVADPAFEEKFNQKYSGMPPGGTIPIEIRRGTQRITLNAPVRFNTTETRRLIEVTNASPKAVRVRDGLLNGTLQQ